MLASNITAKKIIMLVLIASGLFIALYIIFSLPWPHPPLWQIEKFTSIQLPASSKVIDSYGRFFLEIDILAKVEIDKADIEPFIKSIHQPLILSESDSDKQSFISKKHNFTWWNPTDSRKFMIVKMEETSNQTHYKICEMFIDLDNPDKAMIYINYVKD